MGQVAFFPPVFDPIMKTKRIPNRSDTESAANALRIIDASLLIALRLRHLRHVPQPGIIQNLPGWAKICNP